MNSRDRVLTSLNHHEPDRVPVDLAGTRSSGIAAIAYAKLRDYLGLEKRTIRVYDIIQQLAIVDEDVLDLFNVDTIELGRAFALEDGYWADWTLPDGTPCQVPAWCFPERAESRWVIRSPKGRVIAHMPDGALYFEQTYWPFAEDEANYASLAEAMSESMWTGISSPPGPLVSGLEGYKVLAEGAKKLRQSTDRAIVGLFGGNLLELGQFLYRNDNFFLLLAGEPERAHAFLNKATEMYLVNLEKYLTAVGSYIDAVFFNDDLGMQTGPQISPRMYRQFFKPHNQAMWRRAKELSSAKVMLHCCGGIRELLPDLIDEGLEGFNPVQITCQGMDAERLKQDFGKDMVFWGGGCDTRDVLPHGTPEQVTRHVKEQVAILSPGGGFIFQQVHNIQADVPPENVVAMYQAVT